MNTTLSQKEITAMLRAWGGGDHEATEELIHAVYRELRLQARYQLRRERNNHTLHTTALINEVYIKLVEQRSVKWENRGHFFALAAKLMRRILVDHAKTRHRKKRGGAEENLALDDVLKTNVHTAPDEKALDLLALDEALERLAKIDKQQVQIVELRYFSGLDVHETAEVLKISTATVKRDWAVARAWLKHELTRGEKT
jgi:RNA polymerase sigma factor (TIGR02999 family)